MKKSDLRKILSIMAAAMLMLAFAGCNDKQTPAEAYLAEHSPEQLCEYFELACFFTHDYANPKECSTWDMYRFGLLNGVEERIEYCEEDKLYHMPLAYFDEVFERYFVEWEFDPTFFEERYDPEKQELVDAAIGFGGDNNYYEFVSANAVSDDEVEVRLLSGFNADVPPEDPEGLWTYQTIYADHVIRAKIVDGEARFISWSMQNR